MAGRAQGNLGASLGAARALAPRGRLARLALWVGLAVSAVAVWLAVRHVDFGATWRALADVHWWVLPPSLAILAAGVWLRVLRWRSLFAQEARPPLGATARALLAGLFFNLVLPARAGEVMRALVLSRETGGPRAEVLATVVVERIYDVLALLVLLLAAAPFLPHVSWVGTAAIVAGVLVVGLTLVAVALIRHDERPVRFLLGLLPFVSAETASAAASNVVRGLASFVRPRIALLAFGLTLASWLVLAGSTTVLLVGFGFGADLGFSAGLLVVVATNLAMIVPSSPAAVGTFEAGVLIALSAFGVGSSNALSFALLLHAENFFPLLAAGFLALHAHVAVVRRRAGATLSVP